MLPLFLLSTALMANAISLPRADNSTSAPAATSSPVYIACVADTKIASLTSSTSADAASRAACSATCAADGQWDIAYFRHDIGECYCAPASDAPGSDEVVYATDDKGNCRTQDDASAEYLTSAYTLSTCYIPPINDPSTTFNAQTALGCFTGCPSNSTSITVRPEYNDDSDTFGYECGCYEVGEEVGEGHVMDCGFGIDAVYVKA